jgi:hypothetical protein
MLSLSPHVHDILIKLQAVLVIRGVTFSGHPVNTKTVNNVGQLFWYLIVHISIKKGKICG